MTRSAIFLLIAASALGGCASQPSVVDSNSYSSLDGRHQVDRDMQECAAIAQSEATTPSQANDNKVAEKVARRSASSAANSAIMGVIRGGAGQGALIGALTGATSAIVGSMFDSSQSAPDYDTLVERCMADRGHDVAGLN